MSNTIAVAQTFTRDEHGRVHHTTWIVDGDNVDGWKSRTIGTYDDGKQLFDVVVYHQFEMGFHINNHDAWSKVLMWGEQLGLNPYCFVAHFYEMSLSSARYRLEKAKGTTNE